MLTTLFFTIVCGAIFPLSGCLLQKSWSNMLGDVYSVGIGSAACFGGALSAYLGFPIYLGALLACVASSLLTYCVARFTSVQKFLTFGMIYGSVIGALGTIVATNADPEALQSYYRWSSSSFFDIDTIKALPVLFSLLLFPLAFRVNKSLVYLIVSLTISTLLPAVGFVGMISLVAPNVASLMYPNASFHFKCEISALIGVALLLITNTVVYLNPFQIYLPASATMALISAPLLAFTMRK